MIRKAICGMALFCFVLLLTGVAAYAYTQEEIDMMTGPSTGVPNTWTANGQSGWIQVPYGQLVNATDNEDGTYTFEGKRYRIDSNWGEHCLTGYAATGNCTASGKMPTVYHTVSGPRSMLGKVCLIRGKRLSNGKTGTEKTYDGIYVFEDTGGTAVEYGLPTTMNTPVVDIYRETLDEARAVSANGQIVADVYILSEVK